jgi:predicted pyridoxine 5'-phosphate oxidase superfamily flavin-nucleotide-binding protein
MTIKWEDYAAVRTIDEDQVGGFYPQGSLEVDEEGVTEIITPTWGHLHKASDRLRVTEEEAMLIDEDFDETGSPRKQAPE